MKHRSPIKMSSIFLEEESKYFGLEKVNIVFKLSYGLHPRKSTHILHAFPSLPPPPSPLRTQNCSKAKPS